MFNPTRTLQRVKQVESVEGRGCGCKAYVRLLVSQEHNSKQVLMLQEHTKVVSHQPTLC